MSRFYDVLKGASQSLFQAKENLEIDEWGDSQIDGLKIPIPSGFADPDPSKPQPLESREGAVGSKAASEDANFAASLHTFVEKCPHGEWFPDPAMTFFSNSDAIGPGNEEFRTLRARLNLIRKRQDLRTLLVTSSIPGEGKTFVAVNLACVLGWQRDSRVLLVDGDMRVPNLHSALGVPAAPGLSDYLSGNVQEFEIIKRGPLDNVYFLTSGERVPHANELIGNGRLKVLLHRLATAFDWIIIDSPPALPVSDARLIAESCHGVLFVVQAGATPFDLAQRAYQEFKERSFLGVVFNRVDARRSYNYQHQYSKGAAKILNNGSISHKN